METSTDDSIEDWCIAFPFEGQIVNLWNAVITETYDDYIVVKNAGWNQDIPSGASVSFGFTAGEPFSGRLFHVSNYESNYRLKWE